ncbi:hypothetical protein DM01DRAFT_330035 [Hesseltinella vesiculosa]|uniref:Uncharacterized protein n=1 Tax=Hesseltinella vesiculosa TaxID=101127 RepID=A0A1X2GGD2_9FUNG|nr:hypothetical protein DM01DRAFT_330035 [Hesseltinella vesiculosa]
MNPLEVNSAALKRLCEVLFWLDLSPQSKCLGSMVLLLTIKFFHATDSKWQSILKKVDQVFAKADEKNSVQIIRHILELHAFEPHVFSASSELSEADDIIKVWGRPIELIFRQSGLRTHRGDTISVAEEATGSRRDLRILCLEGSKGNDVGQAEFGRCVTTKKLYKDKSKLILNAKSQLNDIIKKTHSNAQPVHLCLLQVLEQRELLTVTSVFSRCIFLFAANNLLSVDFLEAPIYFMMKNIYLQ